MERMKGMGEKCIQRSRKKILIVILLVFSLIYISPLIITFTNSFMEPEEIKYNYGVIGNIFHPGSKFIDINLIPQKVSLKQYKELLVESPIYLNMFWNSVKIVLPIVMGQLIISSMTAYAFTMLHFKGKEVLFFLYIIVMLLPLQVTMMPNYFMADYLNIKDSYLAIILPGIFQPFGTFLLRQSMNIIPKSTIEAAQMDGAGHFRIFCQIVIPQVKSGLVAVAMLTMIDYWNLIDQAVVFIQDNEKQPLSVFLANLNTQQIGVSFAGACLYAFPMLIILLDGHEHLKKGIQLT